MDDFSAPVPRTTAASGPGGLRIGDAERERAATAIGEHYAAGRLDREEFDDRLTRAYAARTGADLAPLFADLPEPRPFGRPLDPLPDRRPRPRPAGPPVAALLLVVLLIGLATAGALHGHPPFLLFGLWWLLVAGRRRSWR